MNKKLYCLISLLLCVCFVFAEAAAFDSPWDHYKGPIITKDPDGTITSTVGKDAPVKEEPKNNTPDKPVITENPPVVSGQLFDEPSVTSTLTLNSLEIHGMDDPSVQQVFDLLTSLKITARNQKGDTTRGAFALSMADTDILSFDFQGGETYYVGSNLFGGNTYMISDEDKFEENLAASIYDLIEMMSEGSSSSMPSLEEIQSMIGLLRESIRNGNVAKAKPSFELTEEVNPTALLMGAQSIMSKFGVDDPTADIAYRYMDYSSYFSYDWPEASALPEPGKAAAAMSGIIGREEILAILDQLPIFFEDNPELAGQLNEALISGMKESNPELDAKYGSDYLGGIIRDLRTAADENLENFSIKFKMDQDANGTPILFTFWIGQKDESGSEEPANGIKVTILNAGDDEQKVFEVDADAFQGAQTMPVFRALVKAVQGDDKQMNINCIFGTDPSSVMEYAQVVTVENYLTGTSSSTSEIDFKSTEFSMHMSIYSVDKPNLFGDNNKTTVFDMTFLSKGEPVFSMSLTSESMTDDPMPLLTPADAIDASGMKKPDYDNLAQTIFMQIMSVAMSFS